MIKKLFKWYFGSFESQLQYQQEQIDRMEKNIIFLPEHLPKNHKFIDDLIIELNKRQLNGRKK